MKTEVRKGSLVLTGTNRKGRYDLSYSTALFFEEREWPVPPEVHELIERKTRPVPVSIDGYPFKTASWRHQKRGSELCLTFKRFSLFHEMGAGKSKTALDAIGWLFWKGLARRALIVCPLSVYTEWPRQVDLHAAFGRLVILRDVKKAKKFLTEEMPLITEPLIVLVNYEKVRSLQRELIGQFDIVVCDESTKVKNHRAIRTKALAEVAKEAAYVFLMTGTPVSKNLVDVFGEFSVMDPFWFGKNFWFFRQRYCVMGGWMQHQIVGYQRESELRKIIDTASDRVLKKDVLPDLPPKVYAERSVVMDPAQKRLYEETRKKFWIELQQGTLDIKNAASRIVKLQEIADGFVITSEDEIHHVSDTKIDGLMEAIEEVEEMQRVVVWCRFRHDIESIKKRLEEDHPDRDIFILHGDTKDRKKVIEDFRNRAGSVFHVQIQTGGMGIDLTCSHTVFFFSNVFEYALREQAEDLFHRPAQTNAVTYVDIVTEDTVDRKIQRVLLSKKSLSEWVMENRGKLADFFEPRNVFRN